MGLGFGLPSTAERLADDFDHLDLTSEASRAAAVAQSERALELLAQSERRSRKAAGGVSIGLGALCFAVAATEIGSDVASHTTIDAYTSTLYIATGAFALTVGILNIAVFRQPTERFWEMYQLETSEQPRSKPTITVVPTLAPTFDNKGLALGFSGRF